VTAADRRGPAGGCIVAFDVGHFTFSPSVALRLPMQCRCRCFASPPAILARREV
jgi:hypothetical protein